MRYNLALILILFPLALLANQTKKLELKAGSTLDSKQLYSAIGVEIPAWYEFWKDKTPTVNTKLMPSLYESLGFFYRSEGFYHTQIEKIETNSTVTFNIDEGKASLVDKISIESDYDITSIITFKSKKRFRAVEFSQIKKDIVS